MRKKLLFAWCMISLLGFVYGVVDVSAYSHFRIQTFLFPWAMSSIPIIIHLIYFKIFGKD